MKVSFRKFPSQTVLVLPAVLLPSVIVKAVCLPLCFDQRNMEGVDVVKSIKGLYRFVSF